MWIFKANMYTQLNYEISTEEPDSESKYNSTECRDTKTEVITSANQNEENHRKGSKW